MQFKEKAKLTAESFMGANLMRESNKGCHVFVRENCNLKHFSVTMHREQKANMA